MTDRSLASRQRGMSLVGMTLVGVLLAGLGVVVAQVVPTVIEYQAVKRAATRAGAASTINEARQLFDRSTEVDNVSVISGRDIEVAREADGMRVRFAYERQIHLVGPAYLLLKYAGQSR